MSDFLNEWSAMWLSVMGANPVFSLRLASDVVWSLNYVDLSGKLLCIALFVWLLTLTIRLFRKMLCGVVK